MRATVTKPFPGVRDGEIYPRDFEPGDAIEGDLARTAVQAGNAALVDAGAGEEGATRRDPTPLPPQPNNPPSTAAIGIAGTPEQPLALAHPAEGTETALPALATDDLGASTIEGPNTPSGGKLDTASDLDDLEREASDVETKRQEASENADAAGMIEHHETLPAPDQADAASTFEQPAADSFVETGGSASGRRKRT